ncbi:hypothetical protein G6F70_008048 [Rhizopus microsporus]|uniref:Uncharacterized protein n=1 Tax=Rhizopus microsporus TaxID=58291 RepID=A0A0A1N916_RHIZD|nr:hypothetical protein G6F71_006028 [Rhizopus microsporus]KAG1195686.1 hypothetical protein G6F70_008048 [Rhizopus microsporus]KAG1207512.1 hypothetical protein G6F69_007991 [Rhizopus microsporus]KAG1228308.1 hypothetical protein G6F67_007912 [Rhizopus microsporus]KAG1260274.1 hypothetical protein G6F68_007555 [Rhizopus microsporus]
MPHNNNNSNQNEDFEAFESMINSMMQGAFSTLFRDMSHRLFEPVTTIIDGNHTQINSQPILDDYEGSDFRRLARKSKQNRRAEEIVREERKENEVQPTANYNAMPPAVGAVTSALSNTIGSIFKHVFRYPDNNNNNAIVPSNNNNANNEITRQPSGIQWSYSSTRTTSQPDGTQITITTRKSNGISETTKRVQFPDGRVEETKEINHS